MIQQHSLQIHKWQSSYSMAPECEVANNQDLQIRNIPAHVFLPPAQAAVGVGALSVEVCIQKEGRPQRVPTLLKCPSARPGKPTSSLVSVQQQTSDLSVIRDSFQSIQNVKVFRHQQGGPCFLLTFF